MFRIIIIIYRKIKSIFNKLFNFVILKINKVEYGKNLVINGRIYIVNNGRIKIGDNVTINSGDNFSPTGGFNNTRLITYKTGEIIIENEVGITNTTIVSQEYISINEKTLIGGSCNLWDTNFHSLDPNIRNTINDVGKTEPIFIGKNVFVGAHSIILKGSNIKDNAIIGAGSVGCIKLEENKIYKP